MTVLGFKTARKRYSSDPKVRARELVAEGKIGGPRAGSGPKPKRTTEPQRASSVVAQAAKDHAEQIAATFTNVITDPDASDRQKMHASKTLVAIEAREAELTRADEREGLAAALDLPTDHGELVTYMAKLVLSKPLVARRLSAILASAAPPADDPPNPA
jgi:hypothetical protein